MEVKKTEFVGRVIAGGRITLPKNLRKEVGLNLGDFVYISSVTKLDVGLPKLEKGN